MNLPSWISLTRGLLIFLFFSDRPTVRILAIILAALTDFFDGYIARRYNMISRLGTMLDPLMDKLFVAAIVGCFWYEGRVGIGEVLVLFSRDISLVLFVGYLVLTAGYSRWEIRSFRAGKWMTTLQFIALIYLAAGYLVPPALLVLLAILGIVSLFELIYLSSVRRCS